MNSSETWLGVALRPLAIDGRIGSTRPMPMKATTAAAAVAQTAVGWRRMLTGSSAMSSTAARAGASAVAVRCTGAPVTLAECMPGDPFSSGSGPSWRRAGAGAVDGTAQVSGSYTY